MNKPQGFSSKTTNTIKPLYHFIATGLLTLASLNVMAETGNPRVNQLGYLPNGVRTATYKTTSDSAQTGNLSKTAQSSPVAKPPPVAMHQAATSCRLLIYPASPQPAQVLP